MSTIIPVIMTEEGPTPTSADALRNALVNGVAQTNPGYTANLPGSLIEDIASTDVGALTMLEQGRVDQINSVTPYGANAAVLAQQGLMLGLPKGTKSNASVYVIISGPVGRVIPPGFIVSDGSHQYTITQGGVVESSGSTTQLYAVATTYGTWPIPENSVTTIISSVPSGVTLTVTNPNAGVAPTSDESVANYRARILQAQTVVGAGTVAMLKARLNAVAGVQPRLVSVRSVTGGWEVICGGGDAQAIGLAIFESILDLSTIKSSATAANNVSVTLADGSDTYTFDFVNPPQQAVTVAITWNTGITGFTKSAQVNSLGAVGVQNYINSITVGQPINLNAMSASFEQAVSGAIALSDITSLSFAVTINGSTAAPTAGTQAIPSDPESYFYANATDITSTQG